MAQIDAFFYMVAEQNASDLHLSSGSQPIVRINGELKRVKYDVLSDETLSKLLYEITPAQKIKQFEESGDIDFSHEVPGLGRFRANYFRQNRGIGAVFRRIPDKLATIEELGLPPVFKKLAMLPKGLVLVTGPTGSGKSTTLASVVDYANRNRKDHILTIEDPIEFVHKPISCLVNQREIGRDSMNFHAALRGALREDPDVILVGEMRDLETISLALEAAETGHLVFATLHTMSASKTVDRIIEVFPPEQQEQVRVSLSESLRAIISQQLFRRIDQPGRVASFEILLATSAVRNLIRENKTYQLRSVLETGKKFGMQEMDDYIEKLVTDSVISPDEAYMKAGNKNRFRQYLQQQPDDLVDF